MNWIPNILKEKNNRLIFCSILILSGYPLLALVTGFITIYNKKSVFVLTRFNLLFLLSILTSYLYGYFIYDNHSFSTLLNVIASVVIFIKDVNFFDKKKQITLINIYIVVNLFFLCYEIFNMTNINNRFSSFFLEPSYLAIISGFLLISLGLDKRKKIQIILLLLFILITQSIIGLIFIFYFLIVNAKYLKLSVIIFILPFILLISYHFLEFNYISERLVNINSDLSTAIRLFLPLLVIKGIFDTEGVLGTGYGYLDDFLLNKYYTSNDFDFFLKYDFYGNVMYNTNIDNVIYYVIASMGIPGIIFCVSIFIFSLKQKGLKFTIFTLILGFSMGFLTLPIFINRFSSSTK